MASEPAWSKTYQAYTNYRNGYFARSNVKSKLEQVRAFYSGEQYEKTRDDLPKPLINICRETVQKYVAKVLETPVHISFLSDQDDITLKKLDDFYEYQTGEIDDNEIRSEIVERGFVDGIGISLTAFDQDTEGLHSSFKGFLKRQVIPFEDTFWENPFNRNVQDQGYIGYFSQMSIKSVKEILKNEYKGETNTKEYKRKLDLIKPEDYYTNTNSYTNYDTNLIDAEIINVYVLLFRVEGEVYFDMSTKYCSLFKKSHALNPSKNDVEIEEQEDLDSEKYLVFAKAEKRKDSEDSKKKFSRYPVQVFIPYPLTRSLIGESVITMLIPNQKNINYIFLLVMLIIQNHAMPKILVKPDTLNGQEYDNSPNQIIVDYTSLASGTQWGITRLNGDGAINSNLLDIGSTLIALTQNIFGTNNLSASGSDLSGFAYQQIIAQSNLILEQPQQRYFHYLKETAKNDLLYFKFYIDDSVNYYGVRSEPETRLQERYRELSQEVEAIDNANPRALPKPKRFEKIELKKEIFDQNFAVLVDVEVGVASSVVSESQHYQTIFQYIASGNIGADTIRLLVENDPALSAKLRQRFAASLDALEVSQIAMKDAEISKLKEVINNLVGNLKTANSNLEYLKARDDAREKALKETSKEAQAVVKTALDNQGTLLSESEVKSNNAKGISGTSFSSPAN